MSYALTDLDQRHHRKELAIMERMEQLETVRRQLQLAVSWADRSQLSAASCQERLANLVSHRMEEVILKLQTGETPDMRLNLYWETDKEMFIKAVKDNFGHFSDEKLTSGRTLGGDMSVSPKLLVSDHGTSNKVIHNRESNNH